MSDDQIKNKLQYKLLETAEVEEIEYFRLNKEFKYKKFCNTRIKTSIWHQARLKVMPLNNLLHKIGKEQNENCKECNIPESTEHFIFECPLYNKIWEKNFKINRKRFKKINLFCLTIEAINKN